MTARLGSASAQEMHVRSTFAKLVDSESGQMLFVCNYLRYLMLATELRLPAMLLSGGGLDSQGAVEWLLLIRLISQFWLRSPSALASSLASQLATESDPDIESLTLLTGWEKHEE